MKNKISAIKREQEKYRLIESDVKRNWIFRKPRIKIYLRLPWQRIDTQG